MEISSFNSFISEHLKMLEYRKQEIILERLSSLGITDYDMEIESKRRFPRLKSESFNNTETIYFNDGSISGVRVVTFETKMDFDNVLLIYKMTTKIY
jgi:hypothetical protein